VKEHEEIELQS
jgi:hypothetical protein